MSRKTAASPIITTTLRSHANERARARTRVAARLDSICTSAALLAEQARLVASKLHDRSAVVLAVDAHVHACDLHALREALESEALA
jgi:hypothetical protein